MYSKECVETFLKQQGQLFDEPVAETYEEAEEFLEECMAVVVKNIKEVKEYLDESGMDVEGMSKEELLEASEIFSLPDGTYLSWKDDNATKSYSGNLGNYSATIINGRICYRKF